MSEFETEYSGVNNLHAMKEAVNYNASILSLVHKAAPSNEAIVSLDFGAGAGTFADMLRDTGLHPECLEPNVLLADSLAERGYTVYPDVGSLPPCHYNYIYSLNVLEHVENDVEVLSQLRQVLTDDGIFLVYVPAFQILFSTMDDLVGHYRRYEKRTLFESLTAGGYEVIESRYTDTLGFFVSLLFKYVGSSDGSITARQVRLYDKIIMPLNRILDPLFGRFVGKNLYAVCRKANAQD